MFRPLACLVALATLAAAASSQLPFRYTTNSPTSPADLPHYGVEATGLGDVDGDGLADFAIAEASTAPFQPAGIVYVYSGATGNLLYPPLVGKFALDTYGQALAGIGDVNNDTFPDLVIGAALDDTFAVNSGRVEVVSGADGTVIHELHGFDLNDNFGKFVCAMGDVDMDGVSDFAVTEPGDGFVHVFSGATANLIHTFTRPLINMIPVISFPGAIAGAGDVDGDSRGDLVVGAGGGSLPGFPSQSGVIWLLSTTGGELLSVGGTGGAQSQLGRFAVAGGVDIDGDGTPDFIGGATGDDTGGVSQGATILFSGANGVELAKQTAADQVSAVFFGRRVGFVGDVNGDGSQDYAGVGAGLLQGVGFGGTGFVRVFSGADHSLLDEFQTPASAGNDSFGSCFAAIGDANGDGLPELVVGAEGARLAHVMTVAGDRIYGELPAEAAQSLEIEWLSSGTPDPAIGVARATGSLPNATGLLLFSPVPTSDLIGGSTTILVDLSQPGTLVFAAPFDGNGATETPPATLRLPVLDGLLGYVQFAAIDASAPLGWATSPGLELRFTD